MKKTLITFLLLLSINSFLKASNYSLSFDGNSNYLSIPDTDTLYFNSDFTITAWVKFTNTSGSQVFIGQSNGPGSTLKWDFWYNGGNLAFMFYNAGNHYPVTYAWAPIINQWYNVAVAKNGVNYYLYIDGNYVLSGSESTPLPNPSQPIQIGSLEGT